jgi:hypothetical protein
MQANLPRKAIRHVAGAELIKASVADTSAMRAEFLRRQTVGQVEWRYVQPKTSLFWFCDNVDRLTAKMDGKPIDVPLTGNSNLCFIPEGIEIDGGFAVKEIYNYAGSSLPPAVFLKNINRS